MEENHFLYRKESNRIGPDSLFFKVITLHQNRPSWEEISELVPQLPRGWYELSGFQKVDRIEFTRDFWFSKFYFSSDRSSFLEDRLFRFFDCLEDVGIYLTQEVKDGPFNVHMIYALKEDRGFYHGHPGASPEVCERLQNQFSQIGFPKDYIAFLEIHDGFSKYYDTGLIKTQEMARTYLRFQQLLNDEMILSSEGKVIDHGCLIPFYESENLHAYQCFYADWFPDDEIGNIALSTQDEDGELFFSRYQLDDGRAFSSFLHWFTHYLDVEEIDV